MGIFSSDHSRPLKIGNTIKIDLGKRLSSRVLRIYEKNEDGGYDKAKDYLFTVGTRLGKKYNLIPQGFWFDEDDKKFTLNMKKARKIVDQPEKEKRERKVGSEKDVRRVVSRKERKIAREFRKDMEKVGQGVIDKDKLRKTDKTDVPFAGPESVKEKPTIPTPEALDKKKVEKPKPEEEKKPEKKPEKKIEKKPDIGPEKGKIEERIKDLTPEEGLDLIKDIVEKIEKELPKKESAKLNLASRVYKSPEALLRLAFKTLDTLDPKIGNRILKIARIRSKFKKRAKFSPITRTDFDVKPSGVTTQAFEDTSEGKKKEQDLTQAHETAKGDALKTKPEFAHTEKAPDGTKASKEKISDLVELMQEKGLIDYEDVAQERSALKKMSDRQLDFLTRQVNSIGETNGTMFIYNGKLIDLGKAIVD